jgi:hypothetical protein
VRAVVSAVEHDLLPENPLALVLSISGLEVTEKLFIDYKDEMDSHNFCSGEGICEHERKAL